MVTCLRMQRSAPTAKNSRAQKISAAPVLSPCGPDLLLTLHQGPTGDPSLANWDPLAHGTFAGDIGKSVLYFSLRSKP